MGAAHHEQSHLRAHSYVSASRSNEGYPRTAPSALMRPRDAQGARQLVLTESQPRGVKADDAAQMLQLDHDLDGHRGLRGWGRPTRLSRDGPADAPELALGTSGADALTVSRTNDNRTVGRTRWGPAVGEYGVAWIGRREPCRRAGAGICRPRCPRGSLCSESSHDGEPLAGSRTSSGGERCRVPALLA
jgi:hypothetical protein